MNSKKFKAIGILIILVFLAAIIFQGFYFIKNYQEAYAKFTQDINFSFDNALKNYFDEISEVDVIVITDLQEKKTQRNDSSGLNKDKKQSFVERFTESPFSKEREEILTKKFKELEGLNISQIKIETNNQKENVFVDRKNNILMMTGRKAADSIGSITSITNKLTIAVSRDTIDFNLLSRYFTEELRKNKLEIRYGIRHIKRDSTIGSFQSTSISKMPLQYTTDTDYLPRNESIILTYENTSLNILKEGFSNSLFSLGFFLLIAFVLVFLYRTIKNQKDLSEIKNDLINNITHEFKTPLATISMAVEALQSFNPENDPDKTKKYLLIGQQQLSKMNGMVEKLLETATLDSEKLMIKKETIEAQQFCQDLFERYQNHNTDKQLLLDIPKEHHTLEADKFHLENALSNLMDNAIKYGGKQITLSYRHEQEKHFFSVKDNGGNITQLQAKRVFDKFYRIPQGNIHNVKGFGIGLYYSKKVIEKHHGIIELHLTKNSTQFEVCLP